MSQRSTSFMVGDGPATWKLEIAHGRATFSPHLAWIIGTFGLAALRTRKVFDASATDIHVRRWKEKVIFTFVSNTRKRPFEFLDAVDGLDSEIEEALRREGFKFV